MAKPRLKQAHRSDQDRLAAAGPARTAALQEREGLLASINANLTDTCVYRMLHGPDGGMTCLYISPNIERLTGVAAEKFLADPACIFGLVHEADGAAFRAELATSLRTGEAGDAVVRVRSGTGEVRWLQFRSHLVERRPGGYQVRDGVVVDVTAIKTAEAINKQQADFFTTLHQTTVEMLGRHDQAELLQSIVNRSAELFAAAQVELDLIEGDALVARGFKGERITRLGERVTRTQAPLSWQAIDRRQPVVVDNYAAHENARASYRHLGITAVAIIPILHGGNCLGTLGIARQAPGRSFSPEEITQGLVFGQLAALVLHQAGIYVEARRAAEARTGELRASEQQLDRVVKNINDALLVDDTTGRLIFANRRFFELFGLPEQDPSGLMLEGYISPEWRQRLRDQHDRRMRGETVPENFEIEILRPDGQQRWLEFAVTKVVVEGRVTGTQSVIRDITERKRDEQAVAHSVALLRATLESTADGILTVGADGKIQSFNQVFVTMWRIPPEIMASRDDDRAIEFVLNQLRSPAQFIDKVRHLYTNPEEESFETLDFKDGRVFERLSRPMLVAGKPAGRVWSFRDVTEHKRAEQALTQAHQRASTLARLGRALAEAATPRVAALAILEASDQLIGWDSAWLQLWDEQKQVFVDPVNFDLIEGARREVPANLVSLREPSPAVRRAMQEGAYLHRRDDETNNIVGDNLYGSARRSLTRMFVPLRRGEQLLGIMSIQSYQRHAYDQAALDLLQNLADHCAGALVRLQSRADLLASEARYQRAERNVTDGLWEWNVVTGENYRSPRWLEMLGYAPGDLAEDFDSFTRLVHPDDLALAVATRNQGLADGQPFRMEIRLRRKDGEYLWVLARGGTEPDADGKPRLMTGSIADISKRKHAEAALGESEERFRAVFEHSPISIGLLTVPEGRLVEINHAGLESFGYTREKCLGRTAGELGLWADPSERERYMTKLRTQGHVTGYEARLRRNNGEVFTVRYNSSLIQIAGQTYNLSSLVDITEQLASEMTLRESEERTRQIIDTALDAVITMDADGIVTGWNLQAETIFGWTATEAIGRRLSETIIPLALRPAHEQGFKRYLQSGESKMLNRRLELTALHRNGTEFPVELTVAQVMIKGERQFSAFLRDITSRKQAESALRESEERFRLASQAVFDVIWDQDVPTGRVWRNEHFTLLLGYTQDESTQTSAFWHSCMHPEDVERVTAVGKAMLAGTGSIWADNYRFRRKDGTYAYIEDRANIIRDAMGRPVRLIGAMRDVTERRTAELALRESEELFRGIFEASPIPILLTTASEGRLTDANAAALQCFGYARHELLGRTSAELGIWVQPEQRTEFLRRIAEGKTVNGFEAHMRTKAGAELIILCTGTLLNLGGQARMLAQAVDITAVRRAQAEQAAMQERALVTQKHEALGTLAGGVAHDFNNILTGVLNYTQLAQSDCPPTHPQIKEYLGEVLKCGQRAKELVQQILLFSRAETAERRPLMLQPTVQEALSLLRATIPAGVTIKADLDQRVPVVLANATQIHQVVMNLGINAAHAMQEQGGTLTVRLRRQQADEVLVSELPELKPGGHVCLEVTDTGKGMAPADLARIFEPFFTTKKVGEGTGLGLAVVHSIMHAHDGAIRVRSEPGRGTTFELFFPLVMATPAAAAGTPAQRETPRGRGQRILLVDDEPAVANSVRLVLEWLGYKVTAFTDPRHALIRWEAKPEDFDVVLTDYQMPGMTGLVLAKKMLATRPGLPVLIMSGFASLQSPEKLRAEGIRQFLPKPLALDELAAALAVALA